ncbi:MAG: UPF0175 family protein [Candidatus Cloacimonetes bacterium]|nr:UPF0175 family protein [Candidatus Cloacimonadota bacterium]
MKSVKVEFNIPQDIILQLNESIAEFKCEILNSIAIEFYNKGKLTLGKAAELANLCKKDFIKLLSNNNSSLFNWDEKEIKNEMDSIDSFLRQEN